MLCSPSVERTIREMTRVVGRYWSEANLQLTWYTDRAEAMRAARTFAAFTGRPVRVGTGWRHDATVFPPADPHATADKEE